MAIPWLRLIDAAFGLNDAVQRVRARRSGDDEGQKTVASRGAGAIEARLAGVVVSALREAFDRDSRRLELEREQLEAERKRAERAQRLELLRQAGDREIGRLRQLGATAIAGWLGGLLLAFRVPSTGGGRFMIGFGLAVLLAAMASAVAEQSRLARNIAVADERLSVESLTAVGTAGAAAPWLIVAGFAAIGLAVLMS